LDNCSLILICFLLCTCCFCAFDKSVNLGCHIYTQVYGICIYNCICIPFSTLTVSDWTGIQPSDVHSRVRTCYNLLFYILDNTVHSRFYIHQRGHFYCIDKYQLLLTNQRDAQHHGRRAENKGRRSVINLRPKLSTLATVDVFEL